MDFGKNVTQMIFYRLFIKTKKTRGGKMNYKFISTILIRLNKRYIFTVKNENCKEIITHNPIIIFTSLPVTTAHIISKNTSGQMTQIIWCLYSFWAEFPPWIWPMSQARLLKNDHPEGTSLVVQWLRLCAPNAGGPGSILGQWIRSHML